MKSSVLGKVGLHPAPPLRPRWLFSEAKDGKLTLGPLWGLDEVTETMQIKDVILLSNQHHMTECMGVYRMHRYISDNDS